MIENKYEKTLEALKQKIKNNLIKIIESKDFNPKFKSNFACYFCREKIEGKVRILIESDLKGISYYPIDSKCYAKVKGIVVVN
ncbi:MAG: hypothetical protein KJ646_04480 [Nanoarchaeota archaeon]|nr:hypothetical protein [Nanoarchaeota archaeon]